MVPNAVTGAAELARMIIAGTLFIGIGIGILLSLAMSFFLARSARADAKARRALAYHVPSPTLRDREGRSLERGCEL